MSPDARTREGETLASDPGERMAEVVTRAMQASQWWGTLPVQERASVLKAFRDLLIDRAEDIVSVARRETDKPRFDLYNELFHSASVIGHYAGRGPKLLRSRKVSPGLLVNKRAEIHYRPLGVVGLITPWNYPIVLVLSPLAQALMAGNAVVLKPSERTTETALAIHQAFEALALPEPVLQVASGGPETAIALAESQIDKIAFTGGRAGGEAILRAAAKRLTPVVLELGGNDAMIVAKDADLERAAHAAVWGAFLNAGQTCISIERCYVERPIAQEFTSRVVALTQSLKLGCSTERDAAPDSSPHWDYDLGPLIAPEQYRRVRDTLKDAIAKGAKVLTGGVPEAPADLDQSADRRFPPTVLRDVSHRMQVMTEETFGPLLPIMPVDDLDEAVRLANDSRYGLAASVWTKDARVARRVADALRVGGVVVNDCLVHFAIPELPFGGIGQSGFGRTQGREGLHEFCAIQTVTHHRFGPRLEIQWFPYRGKYWWMAKLLRLLFRSGTARFRKPKCGRMTGDAGRARCRAHPG